MHPVYDDDRSPYRPGPVRGRLGGLRTRMNRHGWIALLILAAGLVAGYNRTGRGLWAMVLAWAAVGLVLRRRGQRLQTLTAVALGAALMFELVTAAPAPPQAKAPARKRPPATERAQADPWADLRAKAGRWLDRVAAGAPEVKITAPKEGR